MAMGPCLGGIRMKTGALFLVAMAACMMSGTAQADDPRDPTMQSPAARARDRAIIRKLNMDQAAYVRERDAREMRRYRNAQLAGNQEYAARRQDYREAMADHQRERDAYARAMADWRRAVARCRAGDYSACDR